MVLFAVYAAIIWYIAMRNRRRWQGFVIVLVGGMLTWFLMKSVGYLGLGEGGFSLLMMFETGIIWGVGFFICVLPRALTFPHCDYCKYDFRGLESTDPLFVCPECGNPADGWAAVRKRRAAAFAAMGRNIAPLNGKDVSARVRSDAERAVRSSTSSTIAQSGDGAIKESVLEP